MRTYIQDHREYWLVDNLQGFTLDLNGTSSGINTSPIEGEPVNVHLVRGLDEAGAQEAMEQLLKFTSDQGEGAAIISWNGKQFVRRVL
jgi:uncharacterized protein YidB (DUF937 family)